MTKTKQITIEIDHASMTNLLFAVKQLRFDPAANPEVKERMTKLHFDLVEAWSA